MLHTLGSGPALRDGVASDGMKKWKALKTLHGGFQNWCCFLFGGSL